MTLTSTPCDLSTMSLFQDLKLKRRKIDSRCSSDGKSSEILRFSNGPSARIRILFFLFWGNLKRDYVITF